MTGYELFQLIHNYCNHDIQDTIDETNELLEQLHDQDECKKLAYSLENELESESLSYGKCMSCGSDLERVKSIQYEEYQGKTVPREEYHLECSNPSCSYTLD